MSDLKIGASPLRPAPGKAVSPTAEKTKSSASGGVPAGEKRRYDTVALSRSVMPRRESGGESREENLFRQAAAELDRSLQDLAGHPEAKAAPMPERRPDETESSWQRRLADASWKENLRQTLRSAAETGAGQSYVNERSRAWVTDLMRREPAQFRAWLERDRRAIEAGYLDACVLPEGFTLEDYLQWMSRDVADYL